MEGHAVAAARVHVTVERVVGSVQLAAREPLVEGRLGLVEDRVPSLEPVERLGLLLPPRQWVARGLLVHRLVCDQGLVAKARPADRRSLGREARRSPSRSARTRAWCSLPYPVSTQVPLGHTDHALEPAPEQRARERHRHVRVASTSASRPGREPSPERPLETRRVGRHLAPLGAPARASPRGGTAARRRACSERPASGRRASSASSVAPSGRSKLSPCHCSVGKLPGAPRRRVLGAASFSSTGSRPTSALARPGRRALRALRPAAARPGIHPRPGGQPSGFADHAASPRRATVSALLVRAHRPAHHDRGRELPPVGQRLALVELDPHQVAAARAQLVLEGGGWLARDVLQSEQGRITLRTVPAPAPARPVPRPSRAWMAAVTAAAARGVACRRRAR